MVVGSTHPQTASALQFLLDRTYAMINDAVNMRAFSFCRFVRVTPIQYNLTSLLNMFKCLSAKREYVNVVELKNCIKRNPLVLK